MSQRIILASASGARFKLMKMLAIPFIVEPSKAIENTTITKGVAHLVKTNAMLKARDVAHRVKSGLIIGADTVVVSARKRLILKPQNLKEAKKNLKELMESPHWVYSGIFLLDAASGLSEVEVEKTKVFMNSLDDASIDTYHRLVNPLNKAGGFDIEGKGALFIPRIEGCYYNVVGLPLATLVRMLKKFGVKVL